MTERKPFFIDRMTEDEPTESITFVDLSADDVTFTGSYDLKHSRVLSFGKLLNALPIPAVLVDARSRVIFANAACGKISAEYEAIEGAVFSTLFPDRDEAAASGAILHDVFATRRPRVSEATLQVQGNRISGRVHFRSMRLGTDRLILVLVEDLTLEKRQLQLQEIHQQELLRARDQLEHRVRERTAQLTKTNECLETEIGERKRAEQDLRKAHDQLDLRVQERTAELTLTNSRLLAEIAHRQEAEEAERKSQEKFRTIFQHSLDVIIIADGAEGRIIGANQALHSILGYQIDDIMGKKVSVLYPPDRPSSMATMLWGLRSHGAIMEAQEILRVDGTPIPMDLTATVIPWDGGTAIMATFRDVSDRESALQALKESEARYRALFEQASNAILLENEKGEILDANPAAALLTGYSNADLTAMKTSDLQLPTGQALFLQCVSGQLPNSPVETLARHCDGREIPIEITRAPLKTGGQILNLSILRDIGDRKRAEGLTLAQRDLSTRLSAVSDLGEALSLCIEAALQVSSMDSAGILLVDQDSSLTLAAHEGLSERFVQQASHLTGDAPLTSLIVKGKPLYANSSDLDPNLADFVQSESFRTLAVIPILHEDRVIACFIIGSRSFDEVPVWTCNALETITAQIGSAIARLKAEEALRGAHQELEKRVNQRTGELLEANRRLQLEIAHRKAAEEHIRDSLRQKEALLQEVHHRVKNNLQIISSLLALQRTHVTDEKTQGILRDSQSRIRSMAFIHEQLYQSQDLARIDFSEYIRGLVGALLQSYSETGARIGLKLQLDSLFLGVGTALPCGLIINELVSNSLKHAFPDGRTGEIRVVLRRDEGISNTLIVADDGIGLPEGLDYRKSRSLGLRLVTNLTELQLRGTLEVVSTMGTEVRIAFQDREATKSGESHGVLDDNGS